MNALSRFWDQQKLRHRLTFDLNGNHKAGKLNPLSFKGGVNDAACRIQLTLEGWIEQQFVAKVLGYKVVCPCWDQAIPGIFPTNEVFFSRLIGVSTSAPENAKTECH